MSPSISTVPARALSIDIIRGFALVCMVIIHFLIFYGDADAIQTWLYFGFNHLLGDWGASSFLMIMGISQIFSGRSHADLDRRLLFRRTLIRGLFIFAAGLAMLVMAWGPAHLWQWDILTLMGTATIVLFFLRPLPSWSLLVLAGLIALVTPFLRGLLDITPVWNTKFVAVPVISNYFPNILFDPAQALESGWNLKNIAQGFLLTGDFPVFPWMLFPLVGVVLGRRIVLQKIQNDLPLILIAGAAFIVLGLGLAYAGSMRPEVSVISDYLTPFCFYPDSFSIIFVQLGLSMAVISLTYYIFDIREKPQRNEGWLSGLLIQASHSSLTFYFLHYLLLGWPLAIIYLFSGRYDIYNLMGAWPAFLCGLTAVGLLSVLLKHWQKRGGKWTLEWLMAAVTGRFVPELPADEVGRMAVSTHKQHTE